MQDYWMEIILIRILRVNKLVNPRKLEDYSREIIEYSAKTYS